MIFSEVADSILKDSQRPFEWSGSFCLDKSGRIVKVPDSGLHHLVSVKERSDEIRREDQIHWPRIFHGGCATASKAIARRIFAAIIPRIYWDAETMVEIEHLERIFALALGDKLQLGHHLNLLTNDVSILGRARYKMLQRVLVVHRSFVRRYVCMAPSLDHAQNASETVTVLIMPPSGDDGDWDLETLREVCVQWGIGQEEDMCFRFRYVVDDKPDLGHALLMAAITDGGVRDCTKEEVRRVRGLGFTRFERFLKQ